MLTLAVKSMNVESIDFDCEVESLLVSEELPISDLRNQNKVKLFGVRADGRIIGIVGLESYGNVGLLRSLVVKDVFRKVGLGRKLVARAEAWAGEKGIKSIYLLTTIAISFFLQLGYEVEPRSRAPASIVSTAQFNELCPASATFMCKKLSANKALHRTSR